MGALYFRIFDGDRMVVDMDEKKLTEKTQPIRDLREELKSLWPPHELTTTEKTSVSTAVRSIVGHTLYGRDREAGQLLDLLIAERVVVLHAPSARARPRSPRQSSPLFW